MSDIYRDRTEGAAARRQDLLRRRRDELATMPHAVRRVVVARTARTAAGQALALGGATLVAMESSPRLAGALAGVLPGIQPAVLSTVLSCAWIVGLAAYLLARARGEHRFAVAMSRYVLPGADLDHDIERLDHEHPDEIAREMAHRLEVRSAAWPVIGVALAVPATVLYVAHGVIEHGWPRLSAYDGSLAAHAALFAAYGLAGAVGAIAMTRQSTRAPAAIRAALAVAFLLLVIAVSARSRALAGITLVPLTMAIIIRRLRAERTLIAADDPAAGSELFSLRDVVRGLRTAAAAVVRHSSSPAVHRTLRTAAVLGFLFGGWRYLHHTKTTAPAPAPAVIHLPVNAATDVLPAAPVGPSAATAPYHVTQTDDGHLQIDIDFDGTGAAAEIPSLAGLTAVPMHWRAVVGVDHLAGGPVSVTPFANVQPVPLDGNDMGGAIPYEFQTEACTDRIEPLGLHIEPIHKGRIHVSLRVEARLSPARCEGHR